MLDSYIVRIYRRGDKNEDEETLIGLVEDPAISCQRPFTCVDELYSILSSERGICRRLHPRDVGLYRRRGDKPP